MVYRRRRGNILSDYEAKGFTIIEVLVAITILAIGMLGLASLQGQAFRATGMTQSSTTANNLTRNVMERILRNADNVSAYNAMDTSTGLRPSCPTLIPPLVCDRDFNDWQNTVATLPQGVLQITTTPGVNFNTVSVNVSWRDAKGNHSVVLPIQVGS